MSEPTKEITDVKEAALRVLLQRFEEIDQDDTSRSNFATNIVVQHIHQISKPIFEAEVELIKQALGIKETEIKPNESNVTVNPTPRALFDDL